MSGIEAFRDRFVRQTSWSTENDGNPYQMVFVVRSRFDDGTAPSEEAAMSSCAAAMLSLLGEYGSDPDLTERIDEWIRSRIRKIVKRAHGSKWHKLESAIENGEIAIPHSTSFDSDGAACAYAFAPMRASEMPKVLRNLQVSGLDLEHTDRSDCEQRNLRDGRALLVTLNDEVEMTSGKAIAQACHVVQVAIKNLCDTNFGKWKDDDFRCVFSWGRLDEARRHDVVIRDAGFTEVPSGSLTATGDIV